MSVRLKLSGKRFGRLTVINEWGTIKGNMMWNCICDCGKYKTVIGRSLQRGATLSCGCFQKEIVTKLNTKHGLITRNIRLYTAYSAMIARTTHPSDEYLDKQYRLRGIVVCDEWKNSPLAFEKWALENGYADNLSIDRIDNNKGYSPENCRWTTMMEQSRNKSNNVIYNGECAVDASRRLGGGDGLVIDRIRSGWAVERAFVTQVRPRSK